MSATCLSQPTTLTTQPVMPPGEPAVIDASAMLAAAPRVRTVRHVQHPSYRTVRPADRAWQLDARRPLPRRPS